MSGPGTGGFRDVYRDTEGNYYPESAPGAGPRGHDDLPLSPEDVESKSRGGGAPDSPAGLAESRQGAVGQGAAFLVVHGRHGQIASAWPPGPEGYRAAVADARSVGGFVAAMPVLDDFRDGGS